MNPSRRKLAAWIFLGRCLLGSWVAGQASDVGGPVAHKGPIRGPGRLAVCSVKPGEES